LCLQCLHCAEKLVDLNDQLVEAGNMGKETFRNDNAAIILAGFSSPADDVTDVVDNVLETLVTILRLF